jgi:hypothetical protein
MYKPKITHSSRGLFEKNSALIFPLFFESRRVLVDYGKKIDQSGRVHFKNQRENQR